MGPVLETPGTRFELALSSASAWDANGGVGAAGSDASYVVVVACKFTEHSACMKRGPSIGGGTRAESIARLLMI